MSYLYLVTCSIVLKENSLLIKCSFVVREVIDCYLHNNSEVFACAIDVQKIFDCVNIIKLFEKVLLRKLLFCIVCLLFLLYAQLCVTVCWNVFFSDTFKTLNGVKQGDILSPYLFCIFIDDMLISLRNLNVGFFVGSIHFGCIACADDVILLAPLLVALRLMLNLCSQFATTNVILFNPYKFYCIKFCKCTSVVQYMLELQVCQLSWVGRIIHPGHVLCASNKDVHDIQQRFADFCVQVGHLSHIIKCHLFKNYCLRYSDHHYGDCLSQDCVILKLLGANQ